MALEMQDLMALKSMGNEGGMSPYEQFKVQHMQAKSRTSGLGIAGLTVAVGAAVLAIGAGAWAGSRAQNAKEVSRAYIDGIDKRLDNIGALLESEVTRRIQGDQTITQTITDTVSGSQQGQLTATQQAELSQAQQLMFGLSTGEYSKNPMRVVRVSGTRECPCDSGCGYNG